MSDFTPIPREQVRSEMAAFQSANPVFPTDPPSFDAEQHRRLHCAIEFLLGSQIGGGLDDYHIDESSTIVRKVGPLVSGKDVLVLGVGTGREMKALRELGARTVAGATLGESNKAFAEQVVGERPVICDVHSLPWADAAFDVVVALHVVEHLYAPMIFLLEAHRVLRDGGALCVETPDAYNHSGGTLLHHLVCPTPRQIASLLYKSGFHPNTLVVGEDVIDVSGAKSEADFSSAWADTPDKFTYIQASRVPPEKHAGGQLLKYYELLAGRK